MVYIFIFLYFSCYADDSSFTNGRRRIFCHLLYRYAVAINPEDGKTVAAGSNTGEINIFDIAKGTCWQ